MSVSAWDYLRKTVIKKHKTFKKNYIFTGKTVYFLLVRFFLWENLNFFLKISHGNFSYDSLQYNM